MSQQIKTFGSVLSAILILTFPSCKDEIIEATGNNNNLSFESSIVDWQHAIIRSSPYYAAVDGDHYAISESGATETTKTTAFIITEGKTYTLKLWSRSIYTDNHTQQLSVGNLVDVNVAKAVASVRLYTEEGTIIETATQVSPRGLTGDAATQSNDDGANVWVDQDYRMQVTNAIFYQASSADPILDNWTYQGLISPDYDGLGPAPYMGSNTLNILYACDYTEGTSPIASSLDFITTSGSAPNFVFNWSSREVFLSHEGDETPWVIDPQPFYDLSTGRLWIVWGGHTIWISELDPNTGKLIGNPTDIEFDTHVAGTHTQIMSFASSDQGGDANTPNNWADEGDGWSYGYMEGACVYQHEEYYYALGSYGNLGNNYTIRMGRSDNPKGPYLDKNGKQLTIYYKDLGSYGGSFLLGNDANHLVPGHPHIWEEDGQAYLGYDYRTDISDPTVEFDLMGIRKLYWVNDWPTIWTPITLSFKADDFPELIGQSLKIGFSNSGDNGSVVAFDHFSIQKQ